MTRSAATHRFPQPARFVRRAIVVGASVALAFALVACATNPAGPVVVRHRTPGSTFPIAAAVEIPPGATTVQLSGQGPPPIESQASDGTPRSYGVDTKAQTIATLQSIERTLGRLGLSLADVVKMQVFLVGDPARGGRMDFAGFMDGYTQFFGTAAQPNLPSRSLVQVAGLANPGWLVEIEVVAVRAR